MIKSREEFSKANFLKLISIISISNSFLNFEMRDSSVALTSLELDLISQFYRLESTLQLSIEAIFFISTNINTNRFSRKQLKQLITHYLKYNLNDGIF